MRIVTRTKGSITTPHSNQRFTGPSNAISVSTERIERAIFMIRGQRVILDQELARLYGVTTNVLNQAVKRNADRFPDDFAFQLTSSEFASAKSQIAQSSWGGRRSRPWAFTEHGVAMLSSVLRTPIAAHVNIEIIRTFVRLRRLLATPGEIIEEVRKLAKTVELHDGQIQSITEVLRQLIAAPPKPKEMGFHTLSATP